MAAPLSFYRSLTILQLILLGFSLVTLPLAYALATALISVDRLTHQGQQAVLDAVQAIQASRTIMEDVTSLERHARQYHVLGDSALLDAYATRRESLEEALGRMYRLELGTPVWEQLRLLERREADAFRALNESVPGSDELRAVLEDFAAFNDLARGVFQESTRAVSREVEAMQAQANEVRQELLWQASALIPAVLVLVVVFTVLIVRPLRQINRSIHTLGSGRFDNAIRITGPHDLVELGERLDWLRRRLVELEQQKVTFLRHISHELKTPLTNIREGTELLTDRVVGDLNRQQGEIVEIVRDNSVQLQHLIEDLISFSVANTALPVIESRPIDLDAVITELAEQHKLAARGKDVRIELNLSGERVNSDREKIRVILDNLLSNAIKFTAEQSCVKISTGQSGEQVFVEVHDQGPGIPGVERERVFDVFYQGEARPSGQRAHVRGSGMGLAIAREYAKALDGHLEVLDAEWGARLRLLLPRDWVAPPESRSDDELREGT
ncbi:histidine kinase [Thioalkalivibrio denitrificans]|uniref:histidine kinase n=1 Tax=Thioalkalivibrio denitrificans TaxID=108003 RepID=A0A1V3NE67_9GAMM|nr:HAMP domain-containing sensor histidine kinase [Thioalkalivibrio denitrificans]OOG23152.1 histidine kinase [Thioalkalivibrio denitrificans]